MAGLTGWFGAAAESNVLGRMAAELWRGEGAGGAQSEHLTTGGVAAVSGHALADVARRGARIAAIHGRPRWDDPAFEVLAERDGWAASLIAAYEAHGPDFLTKLGGWFAVAVYDGDSGQGLVAIDRAGIATLAYGRARDGGFVFGSTTDAVRSYPAMPATVSGQAVFNFLFTYTVPSPTTIYDEQRKVLPGQVILWSKDGMRPEFYWTMPYTEARSGNARQLIPALLEQLGDGFRRSAAGVDADEAGAFLSGGLDSSTVAGLMARHYGDARTFTIGFNEPDFDESGYAQMAATHFNTRQHVYIPTPDDVLALVPQIAEIYDEPYGNTSAVPAYCCARMAREQGVSVMFAGDGGDEIFGGNERYAHMQTIEQYGAIPAFLRAGLLEPLLNLPGMASLPLVAKAQSLARRYAIPMPDRIFSYGFLADAPLHEVLTDHIAGGVNAGEPLEILREVYNRPQHADILQRMMHMDLKSALADNDLRKVNRMCALAGVEVRYPFLDDKVMAFAASVPSSVLLPGSNLRKFYKDAMRGFLPDAILTKTKHGFGLPFAQWIKGHRGLQELVRSYLSDAGKRGYFEPAFLARVQAAASDSVFSDLDGFAWDIAVLELWLQRHADRKTDEKNG
ncbi:asparagine synthetase B family protein [Govanella unica]|uniref:asparagine synthase (glutamine-hydrolyzing) n=1 Tax=Govanella unica TaxID=2975056 RepID=A0A9X3TXQ3_9PROT|nr:asparagine synthase-related protein [Govania unica]MDA5193598.1 asparagine synthase-related protein [Govania unica]